MRGGLYTCTSLEYGKCLETGKMQKSLFLDTFLEFCGKFPDGLESLQMACFTKNFQVFKNMAGNIDTLLPWFFRLCYQQTQGEHWLKSLVLHAFECEIDFAHIFPKANAWYF